MNIDPIPVDILLKEIAGEEYEPPLYNEPGQILFRIWTSVEPNGDRVLDDIEVLETSGSAFWIDEGGFPDYWIKDRFDLKNMDTGFYVIEGITGLVWKDYYGEVDVEWEYDQLRPATPEEIKHECL